MSIIIETMEAQYKDLRDMYQRAANEENTAVMEKLSKTMGDHAKKLREQLVHERETVTRNELRRAAKIMADTLTSLLEKKLPEDIALDIADEYRYRLAVIAEDKDLQ